MGPGNAHWCKTYLQDIQDLLCTQVEVELFQNITIINIQNLIKKSLYNQNGWNGGMYWCSAVFNL